MRQRQANQGTSVNAIAGTEVVLLGFNATAVAAKGLLGFAVRRYDHQSKRLVWLSGGLRGFKKPEESKGTEAEPRPPNSLVAPIQAFLWGDYTVDPARTYTYRVVPMYGTPGKLQQGEFVEVTITTESPEDQKHAVFFNRGVAGSQAYSRHFGKYRRWYPFEKSGRREWRDFIKPDDIPNRKAWEWLSRGLEEAMLKFIGQATGPEYGLRAAVYEKDHLPIIQAFADGLESGADVKIIRHAKEKTRTEVKGGREVKVNYPDEVAQASEAAIRRIGLKNPENISRWEGAFSKRTHPAIAHNKFIVLLLNGKPVQVWTGSTNLTAGGIFGQSNVGHVVRDEDVAARYLEYWEKLATDPKMASAKNDPEDAGLRNWNVIRQPDLTGPVPPHSLTPIFSPRLTTGMLEWYAGQLAAAKSSVHFTAAFGVSQEIGGKLVQKRTAAENASFLRYILLESKPGKSQSDKRKSKAKEQGKPIPVDYYDFIEFPENRIAYGDVLRDRKTKKAERQILDESLSGLNINVDYLHTKYLLVDPLTDDPLIITGSANFSEASTVDNDENMLVIRGDTRLADIFLTEFTRLFNHFLIRNRLNRLSDAEFEQGHDLAPDDSWTRPYYQEGTPEQAERLLFA
jgi:phosphatidylserine/phosphatidylglycerophosphate/cardiolipin synthase-like enzyme